MDCDCETGCYKCSNYPKEMDEHVKQTKCEGCKSFICHCGMDGTFFYSYNPNTKYGNMLFDSPPKGGCKRVIYLDIRNRHTKGPILDDEVSVKYIPINKQRHIAPYHLRSSDSSAWNRLSIKCQLKL